MLRHRDCVTTIEVASQPLVLAIERRMECVGTTRCEHSAQSEVLSGHVLRAIGVIGIAIGVIGVAGLGTCCEQSVYSVLQSVLLGLLGWARVASLGLLRCHELRAIGVIGLAISVFGSAEWVRVARNGRNQDCWATTQWT